MTKEELIKLVEKLIKADYKTEKEGDELLDLLETNVLCPNISDLIFWDERELTAEQ